jgi:hypothetical protein
MLLLLFPIQSLSFSLCCEQREAFESHGWTVENNEKRGVIRARKNGARKVIVTRVEKTVTIRHLVLWGTLFGTVCWSSPSVKGFHRIKRERRPRHPLHHTMNAASARRKRNSSPPGRRVPPSRSAAAGAKKKGEGDPGDPSSPPSPVAKRQRLQSDLLELQRLLYIMQQPEPAGAAAMKGTAPNHQEAARADLARSLWGRVCAADLLQRRDPRLHAELERQVGAVCRRRQAAEEEERRRGPSAAASEGRPGSDDDDDPVRRIFFGTGAKKSIRAMAAAETTTPSRQSATSPPAVGGVDGEEIVSPPHPPRPSARTPPSAAGAAAAPNVRELQREQREQMEGAIRQMASQMKARTEKLHSALRGQTEVLLEDVRDAAEENVDGVTKVAGDVRERNRASWRRTVGTWTMLFTVVGVFVATLLTIVVVPKQRPGRSGNAPCLFFCPSRTTTTTEEDEKFCRTLPGGRQECIDVSPKNNELYDRLVNEPVHVTINQHEHEVWEEEEPTVVMNQQEADEEEEEDAKQVTSGSTEESVTVHDDVTNEEVAEPRDEVAGQESKSGQGGVESTDEEEEEEEEEVEFDWSDMAGAAGSGDAKRLSAYLGQVVPERINDQDPNGWGLLHEAARSGSVETVELLLRKGCDAQLRTNEGETALDLAVIYHGGDHPIFELLGDALTKEAGTPVDGDERADTDNFNDKEEEEDDGDDDDAEEAQRDMSAEEVKEWVINNIKIPSDAEMRESVLKEYEETRNAGDSHKAYGYVPRDEL